MAPGFAPQLAPPDQFTLRFAATLFRCLGRSRPKGITCGLGGERRLRGIAVRAAYSYSIHRHRPPGDADQKQDAFA